MRISVHKEKFLFQGLAIFFIVIVAIAAFTEQYVLTAIPFGVIFFYISWQNRNIVFLLLLVAIPVSFEYSFSSNLGTDVPDEALMLIVSGLFVAYWIYSPGAVSREKLGHPLLFLLLIGFAWMLVAALFSTNSVISFKFLLAKCWYIGAFVLAPLIIFRNIQFIRAAAIALAGAMFLVTAIVMCRHFGYGFRFANINEAAAPFFRNHVNYSAMLVCLIPVLFAFYSGTKIKKKKSLLLGVILVSLIALFFSYARGAWAALIIGLVAYWMIKKKMLFYGFVVSIFLVLAGILWLKSNDRYLKFANDYDTTIFHENFTEHLIATYKLKDVSTAERFYRWIAGVRMIKDKPLTGYGPNTFYSNYRGYVVPAFKTWVSNNNDRSTVHNYFLLTVIEQGIPGLLLLLVLFGTMLYYAQYLYHRIKAPFYKTTAITAGVMITMIIVVNLLSDLIETDKIGSLFFLCLATLIVTDVNTRRELDLSPDI